MNEGLARHDRWSSGEAYERYVGRWSRPVAGDFVAWLALAVHSDWLDVGCGTGALTEVLLAQAAPGRVEGIDASEAYVATARAAVVDTRVAFRVGDAQESPFRDGEFDAAVSGLVLNFVPDGRRMVSEMRRVVKGGGTVAVYVWDYAGEMQLMRRFWDAAVALDPDVAALDEGARFSVTRPESLKALFEDAGLGEVSSRTGASGSAHGRGL
jgi:SAM-dependent methyltransferase